MTSYLDRARQDLIDQEFTRSSFANPSFSNARGYRAQASAGQSDVKPLLMDDSIRSSAGSDELGARPLQTAALRGRMAGDALSGLAQAQAAKTQADAMKDAAAARSQGGLGGALLQGGLTIASGLLFCDERLKQDIAPLDDAHAGDELSELAWIVRALRERA